MNFLLLMSFALGGFLVMWAIQAIVQVSIGVAITPPLAYKQRDGETPQILRWTGKILVHSLWVFLLVCFPLAVGETFVTYFGRAFSGSMWVAAAAVFGLSLVVMAIGYWIEIAVGWVDFEPQLDDRTRRIKLIRRCLSPWPVAILEEMIFRGLLLEQIYQSLPTGPWAAAFAIVLSGAVFSAVHFLRPANPSVSQWQAAFGLFVVGSVLGVAYFVGGRTLWFPIAIHAAGILVTETMRLYTVYKARPFIIGYPTFPHCGVMGVSFLALITVMVASLFTVPASGGTGVSPALPRLSIEGPSDELDDSRDRGVDRR